MLVLYLFDANKQRLVNALFIHSKDNITRASAFVKQYQDENNTTLIRAVLGKNTLTVLQEGDEIILNDGYAKGALA
jgi:hypothetical protein